MVTTKTTSVSEDGLVYACVAASSSSPQATSNNSALPTSCPCFQLSLLDDFQIIMLKASVASPKLILVPCSEARRTPTPPTRSDGDVAPSGLPKPHQALKLNETTIQMGTHDLHCCIRELKALTSGHAPHTTTRNGRSCRATEPSGVLRAQTLSEDAVRHASEANWRIR